MAEMAKKLNISEGYYCLIENGKRQKRMDVTILTKVASILDVSLADAASFEAEKL